MNLAPMTLLAADLSSNQIFVLSIMAMVFAVPVVGIIAGACRKSVTTREREQTRREVAAYVATGEPLDKAGAYGVQGPGGIFVERVEGNYFNVIGLPLPLLYKMLIDAGEIVI